MNLFATIAATSMLSQASEKIVDINNELYEKKQSAPEEYPAVAAVLEGREVVCLTELELEKVGLLKDGKEQSEGPAKEQWQRELIEKTCGQKDLDVIPGSFLTNPTIGITWERAQKVFTFLKSEHTRLPGGMTNYTLPKPLTSSFAKMKLTEKVSETEVATHNVPEGIKSFFAFQVNTDPEMDTLTAIKEGNAAAGDAVAGEYGSLHMKKFGADDAYLNQTDQNPKLFPRELKVNNPRELLKIIEAANKLNYQELLNFSSAKLASGIRINDLWRLRALFGFSPTGDYTDRTYYVTPTGGKPEEKVVGYFDLLDEHKWFDPKDDKNALYAAEDTVNPEYKPAAVEAAYTKIHDNEEEMSRIIENDLPAGWTEATDSKKNPICVRNRFY